MAKKLSRTPKQKEYRKGLADDLRNLRQYGDTGKELAKTLLEKEKDTPEYEHSETKTINRVNDSVNERREQRNKRIVDIIDTKDFDRLKDSIELTTNFVLDSYVAERLIKEGLGDLVYQYPKKFELSDKIIEIFLSFDKRDHMNRHDTQWIVNYLIWLPNDITGLTKKSVENLFKSNILRTAITRNLDKFEGLDKGTLFMILDREGELGVEEFKEVVSRLKYFSGLDKEVFLALVSKINTRFHYDSFSRWKILSKSFDSFEGLDEEIANMLTEKGYGRYVAKHPEKFGLKKEK